MGLDGVKMAYVVKYADELFLLWAGVPNPFRQIGTFCEEKAARHGMKMWKNCFLPYVKTVLKEEINFVRNYHRAMYQVKYRDFFFYVGYEKEREVHIKTNEEELASLYGLPLEGNLGEDAPYCKWVPREEIIPMIELDANIGYFINDPAGGAICYIVESTESHYLVKTNQYRRLLEIQRKYSDQSWEERPDGWFYQWLPKEKVYVYKDHDETFRY